MEHCRQALEVARTIMHDMTMHRLPRRIAVYERDSLMIMTQGLPMARSMYVAGCLESAKLTTGLPS